jgi:hypothetical protein
MLRITVHDKLGVLRFQLEGRLTGPRVRVLEECWQSVLDRQRQLSLHVDLTGVTSIDAAGRTCLAALHRQGAEFIAADCLTKAVVDEITQMSFADRKRPKDSGESKLEGSDPTIDACCSKN